jgi:hypothetical protein
MEKTTCSASSDHYTKETVKEVKQEIQKEGETKKTWISFFCMSYD